jgi:hypothetical protein
MDQFGNRVQAQFNENPKQSWTMIIVAVVVVAAIITTVVILIPAKPPEKSPGATPVTTPGSSSGALPGCTTDSQCKSYEGCTAGACVPKCTPTCPPTHECKYNATRTATSCEGNSVKIAAAKDAADAAAAKVVSNAAAAKDAADAAAKAVSNAAAAETTRIATEDAKCYARRYPDLCAAFCNAPECDPTNVSACNIAGLDTHWNDYGKGEGRDHTCAGIDVIESKRVERVTAERAAAKVAANAAKVAANAASAEAFRVANLDENWYPTLFKDGQYYRNAMAGTFYVDPNTHQLRQFTSPGSEQSHAPFTPTMVSDGDITRALAYKRGPPMIPKDGFNYHIRSGGIYRMDNGQIRGYPDWPTYLSYGTPYGTAPPYKEVDWDSDLAAVPEGAPLPFNYEAKFDSLFKNGGTYRAPHTRIVQVERYEPYDSDGWGGGGWFYDDQTEDVVYEEAPIYQFNVVNNRKVMRKYPTLSVYLSYVPSGTGYEERSAADMEWAASYAPGEDFKLKQPYHYACNQAIFWVANDQKRGFVQWEDYLSYGNPFGTEPPRTYVLCQDLEAFPEGPPMPFKR